MGCATGMVKYLVFVFNLIFALAGLILLVVGVLYKLNFNNISNTVENGAIGVAPTSMVVIGAVVFIIAFFGCCGAVKESTCMLTTYAVILIVIFVLQIAVGVYAFLQVQDNNNDFQSEIRRDLQRTFERYNNDKAAKDSFNLMQHTLQCCGVQSPSDWNSPNLPSSCCKENKSPCNIADSGSFDEGCAKKLYTTLRDNMRTIGYIAIGLCATELIAAIFSLCLTSSIKNERRRGGYA